MKLRKRMFTGIMAFIVSAGITSGCFDVRAYAMDEETDNAVVSDEENSSTVVPDEKDDDAVEYYGSFSAYLPFSSPISIDTVESQNISVSLIYEGSELENVLFSEGQSSIGGYPAQFSVLGEEKAEGLELQISDVPYGNYELVFKGNDFKAPLENIFVDNESENYFEAEENNENSEGDKEPGGKTDDNENIADDDKTEDENTEEGKDDSLKDETLKDEANKDILTEKNEKIPQQLFSVTATPQGSIGATLRFDYPQKLETIIKQNITATLLDSSENAILSTDLKDKSSTENINGYTVSLTAKGDRGVPIDMLPNSDMVIAYDINISGLPQGSYKLNFYGQGYKEYISNPIDIEDFSRHLVVGTSDSTFTIGDVNSDGAVDDEDLNLVSEALGETDNGSLSLYDMNKDGVINIVDIAYVNHQIGAAGDEEIFDTDFILLDTITVVQDNITVEEGDLNDLFILSDNAVKLSSAAVGEPIEIPIEFNGETVEIQEIEIASPAITGAVLGGVAIIEDENGQTFEVPFDNEQEFFSFVEYTEEDTGVKKVTINLGKRVPVKKVTIKVTKVQDQETGGVSYAVVQQIRFLKDIVPDVLTPVNTTVRNLKTEEGNESVTLTWTGIPNVTGYVVKYGTESKNYTSTVTVDTTKAVISGLKNLTEYYFIVIPINGDWSGTASAEVSAIPQPSSAPLPPDMLKVQEMNGALKFSWNKSKNADYYKVYYRENQEGKEFILADENINDGKITETTKTIGGLTNDVEYELYVIAGNSAGESKPSLKVVGTPNEIVVEKPEGIPDGNISIESIESIKMFNPNNVLQSEYPNGFDVKNVIDGDYSTHWTARAFWESSAFIITFKEPIDMNHLIYVPRLDGKYRESLNTYSIKVADSENGEFTQIARGNVRNSPKTTGFAIMPFPKTKVKTLEVSCAQWNGSPTDMSLSELLFYEYDPAKDISAQVEALFANPTLTALSSGVTQEQISALSSVLEENSDYLVDSAILKDELTLAEGLLNNNANALGAVHEGIGSRSGLQPLGVSAEANTSVTIYADIPDGEKVSIVATQYFAEAAAWQKTVIAELEPGRNIFVMPAINDLKVTHGGPLYYTYTGSNGDSIKLHVRLSTKIPTLELSDWYNLSQSEREQKIRDYVLEMRSFKQSGFKNIFNATEISMPNVLLSIAADKVKAALPSDDTEAVTMLYNNVEAWEDFMHIAKYTQGIEQTYENSDFYTERQNVRYMRMFGEAFMYAAGSHIGIGYGSCAGTVKGSPVSLLEAGAKSNRLFGWGLGHEVGHNMDKLGKAEITNNIYSLMIQTYDGNDNILPSRLETSNKYEEIFSKTALGAPGSANNVFVQLGMYWQLHLAYDEGVSNGGDPMAFYNEFFKSWKNGEANSFKNYDDRFAVVASQTAGKDLSEFFTRWGMELSQEAKDIITALPSEDRAVWYLNDESRRLRIAGEQKVNIAPGALTIDANATDKEVNITISGADTSKLNGFEILRNGKPIAFTNSTSYTDIIGTANNLTFTYTVRAVDRLGYYVADSNEAPIRISYTNTISSEHYTSELSGDVLTITMKEQMPTTGFVIKNAPALSGNYTVEIKADENSSWITAKTGSYSENLSSKPDEFVCYFNKPKADPSDTRMWTYDAKEIKITGIPAGAVDIGIIDYPGDNISFYDGAMVGRMAHDYTYDTLDGTETISKDTVVVIGNYRGNPLYNTVQINGQFVEKDAELENDGTTTERAVAGYSLLFAEVPDDGETSDISDGLFIFVPDTQSEAELQGAEYTTCDVNSLYPYMIKAELYITDTPDDDTSKRLSSDTLWISFPSYEDMPLITLD